MSKEPATMKTLTAEEIKELKSLYNKTKISIRKHKDLSDMLDRKIDEVFGFNFSETDDDDIIDTLDYGISGLSFEGFIRKMVAYQKQKNEPDFSGYRPEL